MRRIVRIPVVYNQVSGVPLSSTSLMAVGKFAAILAELLLALMERKCSDDGIGIEGGNIDRDPPIS